MLFEAGEPLMPDYKAPPKTQQAVFRAYKALETTPLRGSE